MELSYPHICNTAADIPEQALPHLDEEIVKRIGGSFNSIFPQFSNAFPKTSLVIEGKWTHPVLALKKGIREWLAYIVVKKDDKNLFFNLQPEFAEKEGKFFDEDYEMLPESWKELYRWFDSFCVTEESYAQMNWWNTPFRFSARLDLEDYEKGSRASRKQTEEFAKKIGCKREHLRCFLLTENEDALFVNEKACDGKVFHVQGKEMNTVTELLDPRSTLDDFLSFLLSGSPPSNYQFI